MSIGGKCRVGTEDLLVAGFSASTATTALANSATDRLKRRTGFLFIFGWLAGIVVTDLTGVIFDNDGLASTTGLAAASCVAGGFDGPRNRLIALASNGRRVSVGCMWRLIPSMVGGRDGSAFGTGDELPKVFSTIWRVCVVRRLFLDGSISLRFQVYPQNAYE
jgi:hypothetical protein